MERRFFMEIHDLGFLLPGLEDIVRLSKIYPDFKMTCFTIPMSKLFFSEENSKHFKIEKYKEWAKLINSMPFIEIGIHGFSHTHNEMDCSYDKAILMIEGAEKLFEQIGLKYKKIFCAPYWQYSYDTMAALKDKGYVVAINRDHPCRYPDGMKTYKYNWSFEEPLPNKEKVLGHGHLTSQGVNNSIEQAYGNIIRNIPREAKFGFLSELYEI